MFANLANAQIVIPITPPVNPPKTPIDPPPAGEDIPVRPDQNSPGGGGFQGNFYQYCGPSWQGYQCNLMRSDGVAKMRDVSYAYKESSIIGQQEKLDGETAKIDRDLSALREGLLSPETEEGQFIKEKRDNAKAHIANAKAYDDASYYDLRTASTQISSVVESSFGLAYKEADKRDCRPEAKKVNLVVANQFVKSKIQKEKDRADAIEAQIRSGVYTNKADRLAMVSSGRIALEISAQSLQQGDVGKSNFALKVGTVFLDTAISVTPVLGWAKDGWEACTGRNLLTGEKLSGFERTMAVVGVLTAGIGSKLAVAGKAVVLIDVLRAGKATDEAALIAKEIAQAERIVSEGKDISRFGPLAEGPMHRIPLGDGSVADTFRSGSYFTYESTQSISVYRVQGKAYEEGERLGRYWSRDMPSGPVQAIIDSALDPTWGNTGTHWLRMDLPPGTIINEGAAAAQRGLVGGGSQIFLETIDPLWIKAQGVFE